MDLKSNSRSQLRSPRLTTITKLMLLMLLRKKLNRMEMKRRRLMTETLKVTRT